MVVYCADVSVASSGPSAFDDASPPGANVASPWRRMTQRSVATHPLHVYVSYCHPTKKPVDQPLAPLHTRVSWSPWCLCSLPRNPPWS